MRISDWSSDVCSSDLLTSRRVNAQVDLKPKRGFLLPRNAAQYRSRNCGDEHRQDIFQQTVSGQLEQSALAQLILTPIDRKSVVEGKSGAVRVDIGGRRIIKKKKTKLKKKRKKN